MMNEMQPDSERDRRAMPVHPLLFAVAPILFVYGHNGTRFPITPGELLVPIALSLTATAVLWAILGFLLRSIERSALLVSFFLVLFFSYGHIAGALQPEVFASAELLLCWTVLVGIGTWLAARRPRRRARGSPFGLTVLANSAAVGIVVVNLVAGARAFARRPPSAGHAVQRNAAAAKADYPDIYYIIADSYLRADVLKSRYDTDNSAFVDSLRRQGFFVADRARSNYAWTHPSLASSLNFSYLDSVARAAGIESDDGGPLLRMIRDNRLFEFLRRRGYTIVSFASGDVGVDMLQADMRLAPPGALSEFQGILLNTTLLRDVFILTGHSSVARHRERVLYTLRNLPYAAHGRHPVFVFAHVLCPHRPIIFAAPGRSAGVPSRAKRYGGQVLYLNTLLEDAVQRILAEAPRPPVILIQADHGLRESIAWGDSARGQLLERHAILYAAYLPPSSRQAEPASHLYDSISPVNTFRIVLSTYFDTTIALLPDRSYYSLLDHPYHFYDIDRPDSYPNRSTNSGAAGSPWQDN